MAREYIECICDEGVGGLLTKGKLYPLQEIDTESMTLVLAHIPKFLFSAKRFDLSPLIGASID